MSGGGNGDIASVEAKMVEATSTSKSSPAAVQFNLTDAGNGERFAAQHGDKMRYCWEWGKWLFYDGKRWSLQYGTEMAIRYAVKTARTIEKDLNNPGLKARGDIERWANQSEGRHRIAAMLNAAQSFQPIAAHAEQFDKDLWLLNCANKTVDLRTGEIRSHNPKDMITKLSPVEYKPNATLALWDSFLKTVTQGDATLCEFLQTAIGYSATGDTCEEYLFFIHGPTASGKSTFLEAIKATLGDYSKTADFEVFLKRKHVGGVRNDIARLCGARMVISIEVDEGKQLAESLVKTLSGLDTVSARFLYKEFFEFVPQFKLWLAANHAPKVKDDDDAIWRRILRVPFDYTIPKKERDPKVKATLRNPKIAGPAILAWIVKGCLKWQKDGFVVPKMVEQSTEEYRESQDPLKDFFEDECEFDEAAYVPVTGLRFRYDQWAKSNGVKYPLGPRKFNERLRAKGCKDKTKRIPTTDGKKVMVQKCWQGITLKSSPPKRL